MFKYTRLIVEVIYQDNYPFIFWNTPVISAFLKAINLAFTAKIPESRVFNSTLLNISYNINKSKIEETLQKALYFNIITDKSNNRQHNRVLNLYINILKLCSYYIKSQLLKRE